MMDDDRWFNAIAVLAVVIWSGFVGVVIWAIIMLVNHFAG